MPDQPTIAYLTSMYPYATDTFVRIEVETLRKMGFAVHPFSVKRPPDSLLVDRAIREESARTIYLFQAGLLRLLLAGLWCLIRLPGRLVRATALMFRIAPKGGRIRNAAYLLEACLLTRHLIRLGVRHLHNHIGENSATVAMLASEISGIPYSLTIHGPGIFFAPRYWAIGEKVRRSAFTACISSFCRSQLMVFTPPEAWDRMRIVRCGVGPQFLEARQPVSAKPLLVSVGRLCPEKGHLLLVKAAARLAAEGLEFEIAIVGDGEMRPAIESEAERYGISDRVKVLGWMSSAQVREQVLRSRALVVTSFAEGLPVVIMEALALGRPVVATRIAGIPELVEHGVNGWLVTPSSLEDLVAALREVIRTPVARLEEMGEMGARRVAELHSSEIEVAKLAAHFRSCLASGRPMPEPDPAASRDGTEGPRCLSAID